MVNITRKRTFPETPQIGNGSGNYGTGDTRLVEPAQNEQTGESALALPTDFENRRKDQKSR